MKVTAFVDFEFTCWEDSLATDWSDPERPPEVLEIGVATFSDDGSTTLAAFSTVVRPLINPRLSQYCQRLTQIGDEEVSAAPVLGEAVGKYSGWLADEGLTVVATSAWGPKSFDREFLAADCRRHGVKDPFAGIEHRDVRAEAARALGCNGFDGLAREVAWTRLGLPRPRGRHRALADALDVARIHWALKNKTL